MRFLAPVFISFAAFLPIAAQGAGFLIEEVRPGSDVAAMGLQPGDVIYQMNGTTVANGDDAKYLGTTILDSTDGIITLSVERDHQCQFVKARLTSNGLQLDSARTASPEACRVPEGGGVLIGDLPRSSEITRAGFRRGDIIRRVNGNDISSLSEIGYWNDHNPQRGRMVFAVTRDGACWLFTVTGFPNDTSTQSTTRTAANACGMPEPVATPTPTAPPVSASVMALYPIPSLGLAMASGTWAEGVPIRKVDPGSPAALAHLVAGDLITLVGTSRISSAGVLYRKAEDLAGQQLRISYTRSGKEYVTFINIPAAPLSPAPPVVASGSPAVESAPRSSAPPLKQPPEVASPLSSVPTSQVSAPSSISTVVTLIATVLLALVLTAFGVARRKGWGKDFALQPSPAGSVPAAPPAAYEDEEEREITLARQAAEQAEGRPITSPPPAETGGPSWFQQQRERREVDRARRSMEAAERAASRDQTPPPGYYPYPPPYAYHQPRRPLSEWFRIAYWGIKIALVLVVAVWAWSVTGTVVSMLGAIVPAPLRAATVELLSKAQDAISKADQGQ